MKLYMASSWRNPRYASIVKAIKDRGFAVYDFQNPWDEGAAFDWNQIQEGWESWSAEEFRKNLSDPIAERGFNSDFNGMEWADACVLILPCGKSAHMEAGYMAGKGKPVFVLLDGGRPELTYKLANKLCITIDELSKAILEAIENESPNPPMAEETAE